MGADRDDKVKKLKEACDRAFQMYPNSCSHSVWYVISQYDANFPYTPANQLVTYFEASPTWKQVQLTQLSKLANEGVLVVGGLNKKSHPKSVGALRRRREPPCKPLSSLAACAGD